MENPTDNDDLQARVKAHRYDQIRQENGDERNVQEGGSYEYIDSEECINIFRKGNANPSTHKHSSSTIHYQDVSHTAGSAKVSQSDNIQAVPASHMSNENPVSISTNAVTVSSASAQNQILISDVVTSPTQTTASIASMQGTLSETPTINEQRIFLLPPQASVATTIANTTQNGIPENASVIGVENPQVPQYYLLTVGVPVIETALDTSTPSTSKTRRRRSDQPKFDDPVKEKKRVDAKIRTQKHRDKAILEKQQTYEKLKRSRAEKEELQAEVKRLKTENQALDHKIQALNLENEALKFENEKGKEEIQNQKIEREREIQNLKLEKVELERKVQILTRQNALGLLNEEHLSLIDFDITNDLFNE